jgi:glycosylphosphatidylinositol transamidase (GPIT) subunit GPI8
MEAVNPIRFATDASSIVMHTHLHISMNFINFIVGFIVRTFQCWLCYGVILFQLAVCPKRVCISTVGVRKDLFSRDPHKVLITDFFGSLRPVELTVSGLNVAAIPRTQNRTRR